MLSAQCTDKRVNTVTKPLFNKYKTPDDFSKIPLKTLQFYIYSIGLYKTKSKNIIKTSKIIVKDFNSKIPNNMKDLLLLPGIGRKTANIILSTIFKIPSIAVDTHVFRISKRLNLSKGKTPIQVETNLRKIFQKKYWSLINFWFIKFGREICNTKNPHCIKCGLKKYCIYKI